MTVETTTRQDVTVVNAILRLCRENERVAPFGIPIMLHALNHILDDRPLDLDSIDPDERDRCMRFSRYCQMIVTIMLKMWLCADFIDSVKQVLPFGSVDMRFIRQTRFGAAFSNLPLQIQSTLLHVFKIFLWLQYQFKKYKWVVTVISTGIGYYAWLKTHHLSAYLLMLVGIVGIVVTAIMGFLFNSSSGHINDDIG